MSISLGGAVKITLTLCLVLCFCFVEADAQTHKKKRTHRAAKPAAPRPVIKNPVIAPATTAENSSAGDVKVISTADETGSETDSSSEVPQPKKPKNTARSSSDREDMQQTINTLSNQVNRLNDRLSEMQENDRYLMDMERLTRAEQRAEQLRSQLIDVQTKIGTLQSHLEEDGYLLKPENIEKTTQGYGTVHPEEAREARRRQLERDKANTQSQLSILETSRVRLESAITSADAEVDLLRAKLNQQRDQNNTTPKPESKPADSRRPQ